MSELPPRDDKRGVNVKFVGELIFDEGKRVIAGTMEGDEILAALGAAYTPSHVAPKRYRPTVHGTMLEDDGGDWVPYSPVSTTPQNGEAMRTALQKIARWFGEFPPTGKTWEDGSVMSYGACYGSNGERDYMRQIALNALAPAASAMGAKEELENLRGLINTPEIDLFLRAVHLEAVHQVERWGTTDDRAKRPADWFWLVGYLAGKALHSQVGGNTKKALHHCISTAAALYNWHCAIKGVDVRMCPGSSDVERIVEAAFPGSSIATDGSAYHPNLDGPAEPVGLAMDDVFHPFCNLCGKAAPSSGGCASENCGIRGVDSAAKDGR